jgi:xanthine dehydrogenase accessory factor
MGTGVAIRLWRSGFNVIALEAPHPLAVRRTVSFSEAVFDGGATVDGVRAALARSLEGATDLMSGGVVPVLVDPDAASLRYLRPDVLIDAILAKRNTGTEIDMAPLVVGLGPGFVAGNDVHAVVETNRGPDLGRVFWHGSAKPNTGMPAAVLGQSRSRVLRAPAAGPVTGRRAIGEIVDEGEVVAEVNGLPVCSSFRGLLRGLVRSGTNVAVGLKIGDVDPRLDPSLCYRISDKSLAIAGGALEAVMAHRSGRLD